MKNTTLYFYIILLYLLFCKQAYAYLDPGSISIVLQAVLAAIAGVVATYRLWLFKFKNFIYKLIKRSKSINNNSKEK